MTLYVDADQDSSIRNYLYNEISGLKKCIQARPPRKLDAAFLIRDWVGALSTYSERALLLPASMHKNLPRMIMALQELKGGIWCGGCAALFAGILNACYIPAIVYTYGKGDLSHATVLVANTEGKRFGYYLLDSYLGYHFEDREGNLQEFTEMLRHIKRGEYDQIVRVDKKIYRHLLCQESKPAEWYKWLFDNDTPSLGADVGKLKAHPRAWHSIGKLLMSGGFADLANEARGEQPLGEFMLDLMMVNPSFARRNVACKECFLDWDLHERMIQVLGRELK